MGNLKKIAVALIIPSLRGGGAERVTSLLARFLDRRRFIVTLIVVDMRDAVFDKDLPADLCVIDLNTSRVRYAWIKLIRIIWRLRPDIIFSTMWYLNLSLAMLRFFLPKSIRHIARETSIVSQRFRVEAQSRIWKWMYHIGYRGIPNIICQSQAMKADLVSQGFVSASRVIVINNPVDIASIQQLSRLPCPYFSQSRLKDKTVFITVARLSRAKGIDLLLNALALIDVSKLHFIIAGVGELQSELQQQVISLGVAESVSFVGFQDNPYSWMANADALILSSRYEGFPNVAVEALACGTPIISTPAPGGTKEILSDVKGCSIAEEVSAASLAAAIQQWLSSSRVRIPSTAVQKFSMHRIVAEYENFFESVAKGRP